MTPEQARLLLLEQAIREDIPGFRLRWKDKVWWQRAIGKILFFNPAYMTGYVTTIGKTIYCPSEEEYLSGSGRHFDVIAHEWIHLGQGHRHPICHSLAYLFPHWLAVLSFGALAAIWFGLWYLFILSALVFVLPWPAYWRMMKEIEAYGMNMAIEAWRSGGVTKTEMQSIVKQLSGPMYYWTWPFKKGLWKRLERICVDIHNGNVMLNDTRFARVYQLVTTSDSEVVKAAKGLERGMVP